MRPDMKTLVVLAWMLTAALLPGALQARTSLTAWRSAQSAMLALDAAQTALARYLYWLDELVEERVQAALGELDRIDATIAATLECPALGALPEARDAIVDWCRAYREIVVFLTDPEVDVMSTDNVPLEEAVRAFNVAADSAVEAMLSLEPSIETGDVEYDSTAQYVNPEASRLDSLLSSTPDLTLRDRVRRLEELQNDETVPFSRQVVLLETAITLFRLARFGEGTGEDRSRCIYDDIVEGLATCEAVFESPEYSAVMADAWLLWRTWKQAIDYGSSNLSEIPNAMINERRLAAAAVIEQHLAEHPDDTQAMIQFVTLMTYPNISRGGMFGHSGVRRGMGLSLPERGENEDQAR